MENRKDTCQVHYGFMGWNNADCTHTKVHTLQVLNFCSENNAACKVFSASSCYSIIKEA